MNKKPWTTLDTGRKSAEENMQADTLFLAKMDPQDSPFLHFYDWERDAATYGHFIKIEDFIHLKEAQKRKLQLAKRPTGGGIVFHIWDFAFSAIVPSGSPFFSKNTIENYQLVNQAVLNAIDQLGALAEAPSLISETPTTENQTIGRFCMASPTIYDVMIGGKKVAGAAQRQRKNGFLHQGTISLVRPSEDYLSALLKDDTQLLSAMRATTLPLLGEEATLADLMDARAQLKTILPNMFKELSYAR